MNPYATTVIEEDLIIACSGEISSRYYQQGLRDTVRSSIGYLAKGSCIGPSTSMARDMRSGLDS